MQNQTHFTICKLIESACIGLMLIISGLAHPPSQSTQTKHDPGRATGKLIVNGKSYKLSYAVARKRIDVWDESKHFFELLFTEQPLADDSSENYERLSEKRLTQTVMEGKTDVLVVTLNQKREAVSSSVRSTGGSLAKFPSYPFEVAAFTDNVVQGRIFTDKPVILGNQKWEFDVSFIARIELDKRASPVSSRTGKALPPGGGEPGKAYLAESEAKRKEGLEYLEQQSSRISKEVFNEVKNHLNASPRITGGLIEGNHATLNVIQGKSASKINMLFQKGKWESVFDSTRENKK